MSAHRASGALHQFSDHVMADEGLQMALARCDGPEAFVTTALAAAERAGIPLSADAFGQLRPDPIGMFLNAPAPLNGTSWPGRDWLPIQMVGVAGGGLAVDWVHFAGAGLEEPFFASSARRAAERPFNLAFRYRTRLEDFIEGAGGDMVPPAGLVFHMSRCGSTSVSQMLAALPDTIAVSEPPPLDSLMPVAANADRSGDPRGLLALKAMVKALGRRRPRGERHLVFKLDAWQAMMLPLFRRAFPSVPWVFVYRDPVEVLVSLILTPSIQVMLDVPHHHGIQPEAGSSAEDHIARVLERICTAAADHQAEGGLMINHSQLPGAMDSILGHFGIKPDEEGRLAIAASAARDGKSPGREHVADSEAKRAAASPAVRAAAERYLADPYRRLESIRLAQGS